MRDFLAVSLLPVGLRETPLAALAIDAAGVADAAAPARGTTSLRAVDLAPVAAAAEEEDLSALRPEAGDAAHRIHDGPRRGTARNLLRTCGRATKKAPRSSRCGLRARRRHPPGSRSMGPRTPALPRPGHGREFSTTPPPLRLAVRNHAVSGARRHLRGGSSRRKYHGGRADVPHEAHRRLPVDRALPAQPPRKIVCDRRDDRVVPGVAAHGHEAGPIGTEGGRERRQPNARHGGAGDAAARRLERGSTAHHDRFRWAGDDRHVETIRVVRLERPTPPGTASLVSASWRGRRQRPGYPDAGPGLHSVRAA